MRENLFRFSDLFEYDSFDVNPEHVFYQVKQSLSNPENCFATAVVDIEGFHWEDTEFEVFLPLNSSHSDGEIREEIWRRFNNEFKG